MNDKIISIPETSAKKWVRSKIIELGLKHTDMKTAFTLPSHNPEKFERNLVKHGVKKIYCVENDLPTFEECLRNKLPEMQLYHKDAIDLIEQLAKDEKTSTFDLVWLDFCGFWKTNETTKCIETIPLSDNHLIAVTVTRSHRKLPMNEILSTMNVMYKIDYTSNMAMTTFIGTKGITSKSYKTIKLTTKQKNMSKSKSQSKLRSDVINKTFKKNIKHVDTKRVPALGKNDKFSLREDLLILGGIRYKHAAPKSQKVRDKEPFFPSGHHARCIANSINGTRRRKKISNQVTSDDLKERVWELLDSTEEIDLGESTYTDVINFVNSLLGKIKGGPFIINVEDLKFQKINNEDHRDVIAEGKTVTVDESTDIEDTEDVEDIVDVSDKSSTKKIVTDSLLPKRIHVKNGSFDFNTSVLKGEFELEY